MEPTLKPQSLQARSAFFQLGSKARTISYLFIFVSPTPPCLVPALQNLVEFRGLKSQTWPHHFCLQLALEQAVGAGKLSAFEARGPFHPFWAYSHFLSRLGEEFCPWELSQVPTAPLTFPCLPNTFLHLNQHWSMFHSSGYPPCWLFWSWWTINLQPLLIFSSQKPPNTLLLGVNDLPNPRAPRVPPWSSRSPLYTFVPCFRWCMALPSKEMYLRGHLSRSTCNSWVMFSARNSYEEPQKRNEDSRLVLIHTRQMTSAKSLNLCRHPCFHF